MSAPLIPSDTCRRVYFCFSYSQDDKGSICDGTSTCEKERLACEYSVTVVDSPSLCHSVTIISGCPRHSCQTQHRLLLPNSLTHAPSVFFQDQPPPAKWPTVHADADLNQNASVFPSPIFCRPKRAALTPASAAPNLCLTIITASIHLRPRHLLRFRSYASGFMLKKTEGRSPFHTPVDPVQLLLTASSQALILTHRIPIHKIIAAALTTDFCLIVENGKN